jgi:hypothetical protein
MPRTGTLREKIENRIARKAGESVFLPREFADLSGKNQVLRALRGLVRDGRLVRLGKGRFSRRLRDKDRELVLIRGLSDRS